MKLDTDVIITGAGPAGLSAAIKLEELGIDYLLFDRDSEPGEIKPCAGFIPISTIQRMSIPRITDQHDITSARLHFSGREPTTIEFNESLGINVSRGALARAMISKTSQSEKHRFGSKISHIEVSDDLCKVSARTNEDESTYTSRLIIDSSGANPVSQRFIKLRERISNSSMGYGLQYHIELDEELPHCNTFAWRR